MTELVRRALLTFERFALTRGAIEAVELSRAVASGESDGPRLLLLHGPPGSGKTHLLHAISQAARTRDLSRAVVHPSALELVDKMTAALRRDRAAALWRLWPSGSVVTVDDLHVLTGKPATQREVARLFGTTVDRGSRLACAIGGLAEVPALTLSVARQAFHR